MAATKKDTKATEAKTKATTSIMLKPIQIGKAEFRILGLSPLIQNQMSSKAKEQIRLKQQQLKKTKERIAKNPEQDYQDAMYLLSDGSPAVPITAIKNSMCEAAHNDMGFPKTILRKALFFHADEGILTRIDTPGVKMREDPVKVGKGVIDLRYRPEYAEWSVLLRFEYDKDWLQLEDIVNLAERAGFGIGIGEWRPEKDGLFGRFCVDRDSVKVLA
ncbi:MAG: hypothetical protein V3R16_02570 [Nitrospirales bacterium]